MGRLPIIVVCVFASCLAGCISPRMSSQIKSGRATLLADTVNVQPFGTNYRIFGVVQAGDRRDTLIVYATDCQRGYGPLSSDDGPSDLVYIQNVMASGSKPPDRIFAQMCNLGLPVAQRMEGQLNDRQRQDRYRAAAQTLQNVYAIDAAKSAQRQHDQAVRDAGKSVADAVNQQGNRSVNCQPNGNGYTCTPQ